MTETKKIAIFRGKEIRKTIHNNEWWFVIEDVIAVLTDSRDSKQYIKRMKQRDEELKKGWVQIVSTLSIDTPGGKQKMNYANGLKLGCPFFLPFPSLNQPVFCVG